MNIQLWAFICSLFYIVNIPASANCRRPAHLFSDLPFTSLFFPLSFLLLLGSTYMNPPARPLSLVLFLPVWTVEAVVCARVARSHLCFHVKSRSRRAAAKINGT